MQLRIIITFFFNISILSLIFDSNRHELANDSEKRIEISKNNIKSRATKIAEIFTLEMATEQKDFSAISCGDNKLSSESEMIRTESSMSRLWFSRLSRRWEKQRTAAFAGIPGRDSLTSFQDSYHVPQMRCDDYVGITDPTESGFAQPGSCPKRPKLPNNSSYTTYADKLVDLYLVKTFSQGHGCTGCLPVALHSAKASKTAQHQSPHSRPPPPSSSAGDDDSPSASDSDTAYNSADEAAAAAAFGDPFHDDWAFWGRRKPLGARPLAAPGRDASWIAAGPRASCSGPIRPGACRRRFCGAAFLTLRHSLCIHWLRNLGFVCYVAGPLAGSALDTFKEPSRPDPAC